MPAICSLDFLSICSISSQVQQWARITMLSCQVRETANPSLTNLSLNLSAFSENLPNLSLQINPISLESLFGIFQGPLEAHQILLEVRRISIRI